MDNNNLFDAMPEAGKTGGQSPELETIKDYYAKKNEAILKENKRLKKQALDTNVAGGFTHTLLTRGTIKRDFETPYHQALISLEMANEGYFSLALQQIVSLAKSVKVDIGFLNKELMDCPKHKEILEFVKTQIENIGGYEGIFDAVIKQALTTGVGIAVPTLIKTGKRREYIGLERLKTVSLGNVQRFIFDSEDSSILSQIIYLTYPKTITTGLLMDNEDIDNNFREEGITPTQLVSIDMKSNCVAFYSHNAIDGNPLGTPYLYFLYSYYKLSKKNIESMYNALHSFGNYPMGAKRTNKDSGEDAQTWEINTSNKLSDIISQGGGVYVDGEGELYNLTPPDTQKMTEGMKGLFDIVMRTANLGQVSAGIQGGGSRDLMRSLDVLTDSFVVSTVKDAVRNINNTMIKYLCDLNFKHLKVSGRIKEYPKFIVEDNNNIITNELDKNKQQENVTQSIITSIPATQQNNFKIIKQEFTSIEANLIVDAKNLDNLLIEKINEFSKLVDIVLRPLLKKALEAIEKRKKNKDFYIWGFNGKRELKESIKRELITIVNISFSSHANLQAQAFKLGNSSIFNELKINDTSTYANTLTERYIDSNKFRNFVEIIASKVTEYINNYYNEQKDIIRTLGHEILIQEQINVSYQDIENMKESDFRKTAEDTVITAFINTSDFANIYAVSKAKNEYVLTRSNIFEKNICSHCNALQGKIYYFDSSDGIFKSQDGQIVMFPDPKCVNIKQGDKCRCIGLLAPKSIVEIIRN